ncbi:MAG: GNAT family N-acetyltransferase [Clostridia bacterium]|nr:GNAT family N-acetyltransferase [Clostridia bacterium]
MKKLCDIRIRDPYIVPHNGMYYLYGTIGDGSGEKNLYVHKSTNLEDWSEPTVIFTLSDDSWGKAELWAPEVHRYQDRFYLFVSILGKHGLRGTQIAVSDTPDGIFEPLTNRPATPVARSCIDGTLYVENGTPYIVYSHDWPDCYRPQDGYYVGEICAQELTKDLKEPVGEPFLLFESLEAPFSAASPVTHDFYGKTVTRYGSDGPFIMKLSDGSLQLTWSPIPGGNYIVGAAISKSGSIRGEWSHMQELIFENNGGHAMFFEDFDKSYKVCMHYPERTPDERALILPVEEKGGMMRVIEKPAAEPLPKLFMRHPDITTLPPAQIPEGFTLRTHEEGWESLWENIVNACFDFHYEFPLALTRRYDYAPEHVFYLEKDGKLIATATALQKAEDSEDGLIHMVATTPEARGRGAGRALVHTALYALKERGFKTAVLSTDDVRIPALRIYYRLGFRPVYTHESHEARWAKILPLIRD